MHSPQRNFHRSLAFQVFSWDEVLEGNTSKGTIGAEEWYTPALDHIQNAWVPTSPSSRESHRAQNSWPIFSSGRARRWPGAITPGPQPTPRWSTTDSSPTSPGKRGNRVYPNHDLTGYSTLFGLITHDFWLADDVANPVTQQRWPGLIPYPGYCNLGVLPHGRAVSAAGYPITTTDEATAEGDFRVPALDTGDTEDVRGYPIWRQQKYTTTDDDIPLAKWEEAWLIRAEAAARGEGLAGDVAVDLVNDIRAAHDLPEIDGVGYAPVTEEELLEMIIEENRRTHFLEGRFWSTKLRFLLGGSNVEAIPFPWFPRNEGRAVQHNYQGGVRMVLPSGEYELNPNFSQDDVGTYCPQFQTPVGI